MSNRKGLSTPRLCWLSARMKCCIHKSLIFLQCQKQCLPLSNHPCPLQICDSSYLSERPAEGLGHQDEAFIHLLQDQDLVQLVIQAEDLVLDVLVLAHLLNLQSEVPQLVVTASLHIILHLSILRIENKNVDVRSKFCSSHS